MDIVDLGLMVEGPYRERQSIRFTCLSMLMINIYKNVNFTEQKPQSVTPQHTTQPSIRLVERITLGLTFIVSLLLILMSMVTHSMMRAPMGMVRFRLGAGGARSSGRVRGRGLSR